MTASSKRRGAETRVRRVGLLAGPAAALVCFALLPDSYTDAASHSTHLGKGGRATAALAVWMAVWWMSEAIPVYATALLPVAVLPLFGAATLRDATAPYAHEMIFLFLGGFFLARAVQRWGVDRRIALLALRTVGAEHSRIVGGIMGVTALLSMWGSNTATALLMLPIAQSIVGLATARDGSAAAEATHGESERRFAVCLLLGVAYAATIGGVGTLIGTPPNLFLASFARDALGIEISFARWMAIGLPLVAIFLPLTWWLLTRVLYPVRGERFDAAEAMLESAYAELGPPRPAEWAVIAVFGLAAVGWIFRPLLPWNLTDPGIAMIAAISLFVIPVSLSKGVFLMDWESAETLPWGVLVLFGGGLSLAAAIRANGVDHWLGAQVAVGVGIPPWLLVVGVAAGVLFLTEITSNTATAATLIPLLASIAPALELSPLHLVIPAALAASYAFMLPVATPPNAVVFGARVLRVGDMCRAGIWLNAAGVIAITALTYAVALPLLGVR